MELVRKDAHVGLGVGTEVSARQIAHGFNNVLAVIGGHTEILIEGLPKESPLHRSLAAIQESTAQAAALTRKLFEFASKPLSPATELIDPSQPFFNVHAEARQRLGHRITVDVEMREPLWLIRADATEMERAMRTVASYAIDAMPFGGAITFRATNIEVGSHDPQVHPFVKEGRYVRFDVVCCRTLSVQERLDDFEPLRERAARDGVDLSQVFGLIKGSGGYLWIGTDEPSAETALTVLWPATKPF